MEELPKNKGLQVAGERGAASTEERYGKEFLLQKIREKQGNIVALKSAQELRQETDEFFDEHLGPVAVAAPTPPKPTMREVLGPGGVIAESLPGYEAREQQLEMAAIVDNAIKRNQHCIVEAGTGVGKSLAYLIPAIYSRCKTVVSTGDKALQDQLWRKDIPFLREVLPIEFSAAILKGKNNYLCLERWNGEIGDQAMFGTSYEFTQVQRWLEYTEIGDLEELDITLSPELSSKITSTSDACQGKHCPSFKGCYFEKAKGLASSADIVIVNHTLLTLDCALRANSDDMASCIPDRKLVIVDEAHRLEDAATLAFQTEISIYGIARLLHDKQTEAAKPDPAKVAELEALAQTFFDGLGKLSQSHSYALDAVPTMLKAMAEQLAAKLRDVARVIERDNRLYVGAEAYTTKAQLLKNHLKRIYDYADLILSVLFKSEGEIIYVARMTGRKGREIVYLRKCPISIAGYLADALFDRWPTICTSATLSTAGSFDYFKSRVGCEDALELEVGSPFDYKSNALIYMPANGAAFDPTKFYQEGSPEYFNRLAEQIESLLLASDGRAFCLFTSRRALNEVYDRIASRLKWLVLKQGDAPRPELVKQFKAARSVLFGLKSFWEGVDVQGEALSLVIIDKIPFGMPDDPIYDARCKELVSRTGNKWAWFNQLALPNAIITYKQGFGRLIRTKQDRGVVALLDGRITTKNYGSSILRSLPKASTTRSLDAVKTFFETGSATGQGVLF